MEINDLRIGNIIYYDWNKHYGKIIELRKNYAKVYFFESCDEFWVDYDKIIPIKINENWDKKFNISHDKFIEFEFSEYYEIDYSQYSGNLVIYCKYLHDLQNAYYMLTKEELEIKI